MWSIGMVIAEIILGQDLFNCEEQYSEMRLIEALSTIFDLSKYTKEQSSTVAKGIGHYLQIHVDFEIDPKLIDLLDKMMNTDPHKRISSKDALSHPYFQHLTEISIYIPPPEVTETRLKIREELTHWMTSIAKEQKRSVVCLVMAISMTESFLNQTKPESEELHTVATSCLWLSSILNDTLPIQVCKLEKYLDKNVRLFGLINKACTIASTLKYRYPKCVKGMTREFLSSTDHKDLDKICTDACIVQK